MRKMYDETNPESILEYAKKLIGLTFNDVLERDAEPLSEAIFVRETAVYDYKSDKAKGSLGHILEKHYFHYEINSDSSPDFAEAGIELKATPMKRNKNGSYSAKERVVITVIDYMSVIYETFESSHLRRKCFLTLLIYYLYIQGIDKLNFPIKYVHLFQIPDEDLAIIEADFYAIVKKVKDGKAHELSEGDTLYLGACTKGATAATSLRSQPYSETLAKQRAFCFKTSYMTYVLNNYVIPGKATYEKISYTGDFEESILNKINAKVGLTVEELMVEYGLTYEKRSKSIESNLVFRILGLKSNRAEEFVKAGIVVKTIRLSPNDSLKETVSFPAFDFIELANEKWEDSHIYNYLSETKFLLVAFKKDESYREYEKAKDFSGMDRHLRLHFATFWNMPISDIENEVYTVWKRTQDVLREGLRVVDRGSRRSNNFPKISESRVCHVRPHARDSKDVLPLPTGGEFTKQSFFLNNTYVRDEIMKKYHGAGEGTAGR